MLTGKLEQKTAVVTGAASGIGRAIALRYAAEGAHVVVNDVSDRGQEVVEEITRSGGRAQFFKADLRREAEAAALMREAYDQFGSLHILVNNAGVSGGKSVVEAEEKDWERIMDINLKGSWYCSKYAIPLMIDSGGGSVVNIASTHAFRTQANHFPYHSSKAGMIAMAAGICVDFGRYNIRANSICPGFIETPLAEEHMRQFPNREEKTKAMLATYPLGRFGQPEDVASAAVFLASEDAAFITGTTLVVDGGRSALQKAE
ncbi:SDR family oxidoreductase [Paenibacillus aurantius]|uniref:SDR family oxidoreductase n=1 Tax=Paenibacillus aurantius TaxID=2918900 RepID=A0AA96LAS3_9BACL|nr:SDR family oxidoreductase [Paenibacillus aurantius]WNQ08930.1 SDR family oxidoreductase [Paenibacillus aurantius]